MQTTQGSMLESLRSVEQFLDANADKLGDVVKTGARQRLTDAITALETHAGDQTGNTLAAKGATQKKAVLRRALMRDHMAPIARIAAADLPNSPDLAPLKMPKGKPTAEKLAALAAGMGNAATPYADTFTKAGLPPDFVAQLNGAADALVGVVAARTNSRGKRRGATDGLKTKLSAGRKVVHILDAFVQSALKDDSALLENWNLIKRVPKTPPGRPPIGPQPAPKPALPQPTTVQPSVAPPPAETP